MIIIILFLQAVEGKDSGHTSGFKKITAPFRDRFKGREMKKFKENCCLHTHLIGLVGNVFQRVKCSSEKGQPAWMKLTADCFTFRSTRNEKMLEKPLCSLRQLFMRPLQQCRWTQGGQEMKSSSFGPCVGPFYPLFPPLHPKTMAPVRVRALDCISICLYINRDESMG